MKNFQYLGIFMLGLGVLIGSVEDIYRVYLARPKKVPRGRPAGTYEVDMDEDF
jgi:hypothetical protein